MPAALTKPLSVYTALTKPLVRALTKPLSVYTADDEDMLAVAVAWGEDALALRCELADLDEVACFHREQVCVCVCVYGRLD